MELKKALPLLKEVAKNNKTLSILQTIKLRDNTLSATDLETTVTIKIDNLAIEQQAIVNAKLFDGVVSSIKSKDISIKNDPELKNIITVNEFKLPTQNIEEYPQNPPTDNQLLILKAGQSLVDDLVTAAKFTNKDLGREVLSTILFDLVHQTITATDSYKLIEKKVNITVLLQDETILKQKIGGIYQTGTQKFVTGFLLSIAIVNLLSKIKQSINEVSINVTKDYLIITIDNTIEIIQRRFDINTVYPSVIDILENAAPENSNYQWKITKDLITAIEPAKIYTKDEYKQPVPIQIDYSNANRDLLTLIVNNKETGNFEQVHFVENLKYEPQRIIEGKDPEKQTIAFNYDFLITSLKAINNEAIMSIQEPLKPMTLTNETTTILLMPYRIR